MKELKKEASGIEQVAGAIMVLGAGGGAIWILLNLQSMAGVDPGMAMIGSLVPFAQGTFVAVLAYILARGLLVARGHS